MSQQLTTEEPDAISIGRQCCRCADIAAFQNFCRLNMLLFQFLQDVLALPLRTVLQQQCLARQPLQSEGLFCFRFFFQWVATG